MADSSFLQTFLDIDYTAIVLSLVLGGAVGIERESHGRPAGLRTHILVCLSATMLITVSRAVAEGSGLHLGEQSRLVFDPNRMGAGIVTGIGFLGAATVMRSGDFVRGLTTAACVWFVAVLGIVLGTGYYGLGIISTGVVLLVLVQINKLSRYMKPIIYRRIVVASQSQAVEDLARSIRSVFEGEDMRVLEIASSANVDGSTELAFYVSLKNTLQGPRVIERIIQLKDVTHARWRMNP